MWTLALSVGSFSHAEQSLLLFWDTEAFYWMQANKHDNAVRSIVKYDHFGGFHLSFRLSHSAYSGNRFYLLPLMQCHHINRIKISGFNEHIEKIEKFIIAYACREKKRMSVCVINRIDKEIRSHCGWNCIHTSISDSIGNYIGCYNKHHLNDRIIEEQSSKT